MRSFISSSSSVTSQGSITYTRGCGDPDDCDTDCRKNPRDCRKCCTTANCNSATLMSHLSDNALSQTCHRCQYSEVPGQRSDTGCGLAFDATSSHVYEVECPGLCFVSIQGPVMCRSVSFFKVSSTDRPTCYDGLL